MSTIYDNWERLVAAVLKREEIWQLCHQSSTSTSFRSESSDSSSSFRLSDRNYLDNSEESVVETIPEIVFNGRFPLKFGAKGAKELGRGTFGTSILHKLRKDVRVSDNEILAKGTQLVMKLLKSVNATKEEFKQQMMVFGSCRHENVAAPRAYYFSNYGNRQVVVYDYHSQGSVFDMLHGKSSRPDWESRLIIAIGAARGIAHIHTQCGGMMAHGNIKSSSIFLNSEQYGCVSDFNFRLAGIMEKPPEPGGQWSHPAAYYSSLSQEEDVYDFGNLLLELLTGKSAVKAHGFEEDLDLVTWVRSIKSEDWTLKLFDQSLRIPVTNKEDVIEMVRTEIPSVGLVAKDSSIEELRAILLSRFHSMRRVPASYFRAKGLMQMIEMLRVAMRCLSDFREERPKMSDVVLMLENIASF